MDCCHRAKTKNSGLLIPSQHLFSLGGLLGEGGENVGQRKRYTDMERRGSKGRRAWALQHFSIILHRKQVEPARQPVGVASEIKG